MSVALQGFGLFFPFYYFRRFPSIVGLSIYLLAQGLEGARQLVRALCPGLPYQLQCRKEWEQVCVHVNASSSTVNFYLL